MMTRSRVVSICPHCPATSCMTALSDRALPKDDRALFRIMIPRSYATHMRSRRSCGEISRAKCDAPQPHSEGVVPREGTKPLDYPLSMCLRSGSLGVHYSDAVCGNIWKFRRWLLPKWTRACVVLSQATQVDVLRPFACFAHFDTLVMPREPLGVLRKVVVSGVERGLPRSGPMSGARVVWNVDQMWAGASSVVLCVCECV